MFPFLHLLSFLPSTLASPAAMAPGVYHYLTGLLTLQSALGNPVSSASYPIGTVTPVVEEGKLGAVASESDICSRIGTDILKLGGNAADAMVGTVACVGVVGMYHSGVYAIYLYRILSIVLAFIVEMMPAVLGVEICWRMVHVPCTGIHGHVLDQ